MQVVFSEVLAPVRDTMHLIDHKSVDLACYVKFVQRADQAGTFDDLFWS